MSDLQASASAPEAAALWHHLPPELLPHVLACLPPNVRACTSRLVCKAAAAALSSPQHITVRLSQPSPRGEFVRRWGGPGAMRPLTLVRRRLLLSLTAASGCLENLEWLAAHVGCSLTGQVFDAAAAAGRLDVCRWILQQDCDGQGWALGGPEAAAGAGQRATVEWLLANTTKQDGSGHNVPASRARLAHSAARGGHVGLMDWLLQRKGLEHDGPAAAALLGEAAKGCDLPTLQRLYHTYFADSQAARLGCVLISAVGSPTPDWKAKVEWLEGLGAAARPQYCPCTTAVSCPDALVRLTWLRGRGYPWGWQTTQAAADAGNLDVLRYLLAEGCPVEESTLGTAAGSGQLAALQALHAHSGAFTWEPFVLARAARGGHLPVVAWLLEQQLVSLQQRPSLLPEATQSGSTELLAWLRDRGCPWGENNFFCAARAGSEEALECPFLPSYPEPRGRHDDPYLTAAVKGDWGTLACLRRLGFPWRPLNREGGTFANAVEDRCSVPALRRLLELGSAPTPPPPPPAAREDELLAPGVGLGKGWTECRTFKPARQRQRQGLHPAPLWHHLPPELLPHVLACLPPNERACTSRLVCKAAAAALRGPQHATVRLSQPSPRGEFVRRWGGPGAMRPLTLVRRRLLLSLTAVSGCLENLEWLAAHVGCSLISQVFDAAAAAGRMEVCRWLQLQECYKQRWALTGAAAAAGAGQRATAEWLLATTGNGGGSDPHGVLAYCAARGGHVGLMDRLLQRHGLERDGRAAAGILVGAVKGCDLPSLQRLYHTYFAGGRTVLLGPVLTYAAGSPTPDWKAKVEWLEGLGAAARPPCSDHGACTWAASRPDALDRLTWLKGRAYSWGWETTQAAAAAGNLDALRYLLAEGCPVKEVTLGVVAGSGQLAALQALHAHSSTFTWQPTVLALAARGGHLPVVAWLLEQQFVGLQQFPSLLLEAVLSGSMELLALLRDRGCPLGEHDFFYAAEAGSEEVFEWLLAQGCPVTEPRGRDDDPYLTAARQWDWATLACLRRLGCPWRPLDQEGGAFVAAVEDGCSVPALRRLLELGCPVDWRHAIRAAVAIVGSQDVRAWLEEEQQRREFEGGPQQQ
ncbi:Ankyrin repeat domain-containing protein [Tetrabaena socialis]|uniref:Ankyrin repeat domain-containing protein n=1 Tax=Tetrabaena socialis TaxID=47790 RepID=A0A2J7ZJU4_9CHLO|nr:Ankyrin repeat domain-containing protein [Tetrabaena socialis]|eukprot:PNH00537.1 Ankyrin repeat domain-containing protein [Tetrabaena socialis]